LKGADATSSISVQRPVILMHFEGGTQS